MESDKYVSTVGSSLYVTVNVAEGVTFSYPDVGLEYINLFPTIVCVVAL